MKKYIVFSLFLTFLGCHKFGKQEVLVKVDDMQITAKDLLDRMKDYEFDPTRMPKEQSQEFKEKVLNELIEEKVLLREADARGLEIDKQDLDSFMQQMRGDYSDEDFRKILKEKNMTLKELRAKTKMNLLLGKVVDSITSEANKPSKEKIDAYYKENIEKFYEQPQFKVQQIVVDNKNDALHILDLIKKKESFGDLAKAHSLTPEASERGHLGWISEGLPENVLKAVKVASINAPSEPIQSEYGFHIIKVLDKKPQRLIPLSEATPSIVAELTQIERESILAKWKQNAFSKIKIVRNDALLASI